MKTLAPLDELYFTWLYGQVASVEKTNPEKSYWRMLRILYTTPFKSIVPHDENRGTDGIDMRYEFIQEEGLVDVDVAWLSLDCSMLEMIIGISRHISFEVNGTPRHWFWRIMENLKLTRFNDDKRFREEAVKQILERVIYRRYEPNGRGGLFPLEHPDGNQRDVELWYQMQSYLLELD